MKTPKVATPKPKLKFNTPKSGLVRKSLGANSTASLKKLSNKGKEQVLSMVKDNEENVEFKNKTPKKARMSLPANALRNSKPSPDNNSVGGKTPKKTPKAKKAATPDSPQSGKKNNPNNKTPAKDSPVSKPQNVKKTPQNKNVTQNVKTPASVENNTSPVKQNVESKKNKVPFNLDDSLANKTPNGLKEKKVNSPGKEKPSSPEVQLGLQLEEALSPKSKKEKKKKMSLGLKVATEGKVVVNKKVVKKLDTTSSDSAPDADSKKKKRRRRRKTSETKKTKEIKPSFVSNVNAKNAVNTLLKASKPQKSDLLNGDNFIYMQFSLIKQSKDSRGVYKVVLPHCILSDQPEVCLVVPDLKGKRNDPDEAIEHYKELLKKNDVTSITEIIPIRKLKREYSQHEEKRKLANRFDCIISDGRISHVAQLGKRFARAKKCICPINFNTTTLKDDFEKALRKVAIFHSGKGTSFSVKCGRVGMPVEDIVDNIVAIGEFLANNRSMVGDPLNIRMAAIKTALSSAFPLYYSTATPNDVQKPKGKPQKVEEPVEDEVTTVENATVVVYPSGSVKVKKRKNEEDNDDTAIKQKKNKIAKTSAPKKVKDEVDSSEDDDDDEVEGNSDLDMDSSDDEDSAVKSLNGTDDEEDSDDDGSGVEDEEDDDEDEEDDEGSDDDDQSIDEEEIEAAEKAYLEELRALQEEVGKKKAKKPGKNAKIVEKKEVKVKQQNKMSGPKGGKQQEKKGLQNEQKQVKKDILKEQDTNAKGKNVAPKQNQVKGVQNNFPKKNQGASPQNQVKGVPNNFPKKNQGASPQNQQKRNPNQNQKKNKFGSPQNQQKGKFQQFGKGKGPNKRNDQKGGSPGQGKKQFKKGPGWKNKN